MIVIEKVELSKNPVEIQEPFLLKITCKEELATWSDTASKKWGELQNHTWDDVYRKMFKGE